MIIIAVARSFKGNMMQDKMIKVPNVLVERIKASRSLLIAFGVLLALSGLLFIIFTNFATLTSVYLFGFLMIFGGILQALTSFSAFSGWKRVGGLLFSILYVLAGFFVFKAPLATASALTWLIAVCLMAGGMVRTINAFQLKPLSGWVWVLVSGLLLFITGLLIINNPTSPLWLLGLMFGVDLLFQGISLLTLAFVIKKF